MIIIIITTIIISINCFQNCCRKLNRTVKQKSAKTQSDLNVASLMKLNFAFIAATRHPNMCKE